MRHYSLVLSFLDPSTKLLISAAGHSTLLTVPEREELVEYLKAQAQEDEHYWELDWERKRDSEWEAEVRYFYDLRFGADYHSDSD